MSENSYDFNKHLPDEALSANYDEASWMVSYSDLITVLMCFFILFYNNDNSEKDEKKEADNVLKSIVLAMDQGAGEGDGQQNQRQRKRFKSQMKKLSNAIISISADENIGTVVGKDYVLVEFVGGDFFHSGSTRLSRLGREKVRKVSAKLRPFMNQIHVEIQGHTDSRKVAFWPGRSFTSNIELSVLRSLDVYNYMSSLGFSDKALAVAGYGAFRTRDRQTPREARTITLRIIPVWDFS